MHTSSIIRTSVLATGLIVAFAMLPVGQTAAQDTDAQSQATMQQENRTVPDKAADAWITTKVKSEFGVTKGIKATDISVETHEGVVTLSGSVASAQEKMHAEHVASQVKGVTRVDASQLTVGTMSQQ